MVPMPLDIISTLHFHIHQHLDASFDIIDQLIGTNVAELFFLGIKLVLAIRVDFLIRPDLYGEVKFHDSEPQIIIVFYQRICSLHLTLFVMRKQIESTVGGVVHIDCRTVHSAQGCASKKYTALASFLEGPFDIL